MFRIKRLSYWASPQPNTSLQSKTNYPRPFAKTQTATAMEEPVDHSVQLGIIHDLPGNWMKQTLGLTFHGDRLNSLDTTC